MENKRKNTKLQDEGRLAYMIEWRDKRIKALEELLAVHEQAGSIYAAYIAYLLEQCCGQAENIRVSKQSIRSVCGKYKISAEDAGEDFLIRLEKIGDGHGAQSCEVADA